MSGMKSTRVKRTEWGVLHHDIHYHVTDFFFWQKIFFLKKLTVELVSSLPNSSSPHQVVLLYLAILTRSGNN